MDDLARPQVVLVCRSPLGDGYVVPAALPVISVLTSRVRFSGQFCFLQFLDRVNIYILGLLPV